MLSAAVSMAPVNQPRPHHSTAVNLAAPLTLQMPQPGSPSFFPGVQYPTDAHMHVCINTDTSEEQTCHNYELMAPSVTINYAKKHTGTFSVIYLSLVVLKYTKNTF